MSVKVLSRSRFGIILLVLSLLLIPAFGVNAADGADLFVGNFGGHTASGTVYDVHPGESIPFYVGNHGPPGSLLNVSSITFTPQAGAQFIIMVFGLPGPGAYPQTGSGEQFIVSCSGSPTQTVTGTLNIVSDDVNEPNYTLTFRCLGLPDLFVGNFGGHTRSGITYPLRRGENVRFYIGNHGAPGSILTISSGSINNPANSFLSFSTAISPPVNMGQSGSGDPLDVSCASNVPANNNTSAQVRINSNDPNEPNYVITFTCRR